MFGQIWSHDTIRKYLIFFGTIFNDIYVYRGDNDSDPNQVMKVPLNYAPKEKFLNRSEGNPELERPIAIQLPRMSFMITNYQYDAERKLNTTGTMRSVNPSNANEMLTQANPIPWNLTFQLYIQVKNAVDGTRIIEQILPYFSPEFTGTLNVNPDLGIKYDIPLILDSVEQEDTYEGPYEQRRSIIWTLTFTMKAWMFGPTSSRGVIKQVEVNFKIPRPDMTMDEAIGHTPDNIVEIVITPGLTPDGEPTSDPSKTIDKDFINADDPYGFITIFREFP